MLEAQERPEPELGEGDVRIAVRAAGVNFADTMARAGLYPHAPKPPCVLGYEVSGVVEAVGPAVTGVQVGQRVMAGTRFGGQAEIVVVPEDNVLPLPDRLSFEQGAAFVVSYATAYAALHVLGGMREGDRVLIHAAGRRGGHRRDPAGPQRRRGDLRHRVGEQARGDPPPRRAAPDRLPHHRLRRRGPAHPRRSPSVPRPRHRRARSRAPSARTTGCSGRAAGW